MVGGGILEAERARRIQEQRDPVDATSYERYESDVKWTSGNLI